MHVQSNWPTRAPTVCGVSLPEQPHESTPFQFQANAPVFIPGIPWDLHTHDEFVQDLFEAWKPGWQLRVMERKDPVGY